MIHSFCSITRGTSAANYSVTWRCRRSTVCSHGYRHSHQDAPLSICFRLLPEISGILALTVKYGRCYVYCVVTPTVTLLLLCVTPVVSPKSLVTPRSFKFDDAFLYIWEAVNLPSSLESEADNVHTANAMSVDVAKSGVGNNWVCTSTYRYKKYDIGSLKRVSVCAVKRLNQEVQLS